MDHVNPTSIVDIHHLISEDISPKLLRESAGSESCCIVRIPQSLARINLKAYEPKIVSIGPYHHGKEHLQMIQQHKRRFLKFFMAKMEENGIDPQELVNAVSKLDGEIRGSYSEDLGLDQETLVEMMVLDGCFILTMFFAVSGEVAYTNYDDPFFRMPWILPSIRAKGVKQAEPRLGAKKYKRESRKKMKQTTIPELDDSDSVFDIENLPNCPSN